jgi:hypothetical protein
MAVGHQIDRLNVFQSNGLVVSAKAGHGLYVSAAGAAASSIEGAVFLLAANVSTPHMSRKENQSAADYTQRPGLSEHVWAIMAVPASTPCRSAHLGCSERSIIG